MEHSVYHFIIKADPDVILGTQVTVQPSGWMSVVNIANPVTTAEALAEG